MNVYLFTEFGVPAFCSKIFLTRLTAIVGLSINSTLIETAEKGESQGWKEPQAMF